MLKYLRYSPTTLILLAGIVLLAAGGNCMWGQFGLILFVTVIGDFALGKDLDEPQYEQTWLLNFWLYSALPLLWAAGTVYAWYLSDFDLLGIGAAVGHLSGYDMFAARAATTPLQMVGGALALGLMFAFAGTVIAHELTHRTWSKAAQIAGRWMLALSGDASFAIEHVYGHHKNVSTRKDPATSRRGENSYAFVVRSTIYSYLSAWHLEAERLKKQGYSVWSWRNRMHRGNLMSLAYIAFYAYAAGWVGALVAVAIMVYTKSYLEFVNFMEHYGIVRVPGEPVEPRHSWNCNQAVSGWIMFNLTRHSHHHAMGEKPFWELRAYQDAPMLPYGYLTTIILALVPPLFRKVVD
ncbi:MAG: alkane 1-monooxygenase, partial [Ktedonobacterales bacterium]